MDRIETERFRKLEEEIVLSETRLESAKEGVKNAKADYDAALFDLRAYARELTDPKRRPLFDAAGTVDPETGEIQ